MDKKNAWADNMEDNQNLDIWAYSQVIHSRKKGDIVEA